jgi:hypothetical protein
MSAPIVADTVSSTNTRRNEYGQVERGRLASVEDRIAAIEIILSEKGLMRPQAKQAKAINFVVANKTVIEEMIEKFTNKEGIM